MTGNDVAMTVAGLFKGLGRVMEARRRASMTGSHDQEGAVMAKAGDGAFSMTLVMAEGRAMLAERGAVMAHRDFGRLVVRSIYHIPSTQGVETWIEREAGPESVEPFYSLYHYLGDWEGGIP